jgi:hypothetical protein
VAATATRPSGKSSFVKEYLFDNPQATYKAVSEAWTKAGMDGGVSESLVSKVRSDLKLAGNTRKGSKAASGAGADKAKKTTKAVAKKAGSETAAAAPEPGKKPSRTDRTRLLEEVEGEIDRLIFRLMSVGGLAEVEDALRAARRRLVRSHGG